MTSGKIGKKLKILAANSGLWGNKLSIRVDYEGITKEVAERYDLKEEDLFNLTVVENPPGGPKERIANVSLSPKAGARRIDRVLEKDSKLIRVRTDDLPSEADAKRPPETPSNKDPLNRDAKDVNFFTGGEDSKPLEDEDYMGSMSGKTGIYALEKADLLNLLCIPPDTRNGKTSNSVYQTAMKYCYDRRAMLIVDPPNDWDSKEKARDGLGDLGLSGPGARNAALYFPRVVESDPLLEGQLDTFVPCGIVAGVMARTDRTRGVWKAPAGLDATLNGIQGLTFNLTDAENGMLNPLGINCLRSFPVTGRVIWGARTLRGADQLSDEYKYIPVRRLVLYIEESLYRGTQWIVFEPNDEPLWAQIRLNVGSFMHSLFRQGAFQGTSPNEAYFVKCDKETTTQDDVNKGIVNVIVGFAPLKPAEFVVIKIQQIAGQIQT